MVAEGAPRGRVAAIDRSAAGRAAMTVRDYGLVLAAVAIAVGIVLLV